MAIPSTKEELVQFCLRQLGEPVIDVNLAPEQVDDAIDNALSFWSDYHYLASERVFAVFTLDAQDIENQYLTLPANTKEVVRVLINSYGTGVKGMFDPLYQMRLQDLQTGGFLSGGGNLINYFVTKNYMAMIEDQLQPDISHTFSRYGRRLNLKINWQTDVREGQKILVEMYKFVTPEDQPEIWGDWVLRKLATEYARRQWGYNLQKLGNIQLPSGATLNARDILDEANRNIEEIERDFIYKYSPPMGIQIG